MIIDRESFLDLGLTLKGMSDTVLLMAQVLSTIDGMENLRSHVRDLNMHIGMATHIMEAVNAENHAVSPPSGTSGRA
jgi:hypothetical protein